MACILKCGYLQILFKLFIGMKRNKLTTAIKQFGVAAFLSAALMAGCTSAPNTGKTYVYEPGPAIQPVSLPAPEYPDFTYTAETCVKSVVHVKVVTHANAQQVPQSIFDFFFGYGSPNMQPREQVGMGSGVIITTDGYIVTNNHVVKGADEVEVTLENKRAFKAQVIGTDPVTDIALLKIDATELPALSFGDSDALRLGQWVLAIGNPYNLRSTVTAGIVSAKGRSMIMPGDEFKIEAFIQTDAAVNQGNSGGALVNARGELVGINTAIASRTGSYAGYSFAIPSSIVRKVVNDMIKYEGVVQRALLGISMQELTDELAKEKGIDQLQGVYIAEIVPGSAAEKGGLKPGDILTAINGVKVNKATDVQEQISKFSPADKVVLSYVREGKKMETEVELQNQVGDTGLVRGGDKEVSHFMGAQLRTVDKEIKERLRIQGGVEVMAVTEGKLREAGIKKGFVITHVNQKAVASPAQLAAAVQSSTRGVLIEGKYPDGSTYYYALNF